MTKIIAFSLACINILTTYPILAADEKQPAAQKGLDFSEKARLSPKDLAEKREGGYFTGIGGPASTPDLGFVIAAMVNYYYNGSRSDERFAYTPYEHQFGISGAVSTKGFVNASMLWDAPYLWKTPYRIRFGLSYNKNPVAQYFGIGEDSMGPLRHPDGRTFARYGDYNQELRRLQEDGSTYAYYNFYELDEVKSDLYVMRDDLGGVVRFITALSMTRSDISDYSGKMVIADGGEGIMQQTKLSEDKKSGKIKGAGGGYINGVKAGIAYDTRDFEPNPTTGVFYDLLISVYDPVFGSSFAFTETTAAGRFYWSPFSAAGVLALRLFVSVKKGDVPFYSMGRVSFTDKDINATGGLYSMRGYREGRFLDKVHAGSTVEWRQKFISWRVWDQDLSLAFVPFVDFGRVFARADEIDLNDWRQSYGFSFRLAWNLATVIYTDFGFSSEGFGFYLNVNQIF